MFSQTSTAISIFFISQRQTYIDHCQKNKEKAIAFIMKNEGSSLSLKTFVVSIDEIELLTGIDFFPKLEKTLEKSLESKKCLECWKWGK